MGVRGGRGLCVLAWVRGRAVCAVLPWFVVLPPFFRCPCAPLSRSASLGCVVRAVVPWLVAVLPSWCAPLALVGPLPCWCGTLLLRRTLCLPVNPLRRFLPFPLSPAGQPSALMRIFPCLSCVLVRGSAFSFAWILLLLVLCPLCRVWLRLFTFSLLLLQGPVRHGDGYGSLWVWWSGATYVRLMLCAIEVLRSDGGAFVDITMRAMTRQLFMVITILRRWLYPTPLACKERACKGAGRFGFVVGASIRRCGCSVQRAAPAPAARSAQETDGVPPLLAVCPGSRISSHEPAPALGDPRVRNRCCLACPLRCHPSGGPPHGGVGGLDAHGGV